jgi:hypothetical protein
MFKKFKNINYRFLKTKVPKMAFGIKKLEVRGQLRMSHTERLGDILRSHNIVNVIKCRIDWTCSSDWGNWECVCNFGSKFCWKTPPEALLPRRANSFFETQNYHCFVFIFYNELTQRTACGSTVKELSHTTLQ